MDYYTGQSFAFTLIILALFPTTLHNTHNLIVIFYKPMAKMTKSQLMEALASKTGHTKKDVAAFLEALVALAYSQTKSSGEFSLPGLGKLVKKHRAARMGRNPATGQEISIPAKTVVKFRVAKAAKDSIL